LWSGKDFPTSGCSKFRISRLRPSRARLLQSRYINNAGVCIFGPSVRHFYFKGNPMARTNIYIHDPSLFGLRGAIARPILHVWRVLKIWQARAMKRQMRRKMAHVDRRLLRDVGLSRRKLIQEAHRPIWKE